jgi:hypothetical protein
VFLPLIVTLVIVAAFIGPGLLCATQRRQVSRGRRRPSGEPVWWPRFEQEFRLYERRRQQDRSRRGLDQRGTPPDR